MPAPGPFTSSLSIAASGPVPVEVAWQRYDRPVLWPTWSPQLTAVLPDGDHDVGEMRLSPGLTGRVAGPLGVSARFTVLDVDRAARRWSWLVRRGPFEVHLDHGVGERTVAPGGRRGSVTWLVLRGPVPLVAGYAPVAWFALHRLVNLPAHPDEPDR